MERALFRKENEPQPGFYQKLCFTANSIHYLANTSLPINLDEWEWHEEIIDGTCTYVITDKKSASNNTQSYTV